MYLIIIWSVVADVIYWEVGVRLRVAQSRQTDRGRLLLFDVVVVN